MLRHLYHAWDVKSNMAFPLLLDQSSDAVLGAQECLVRLLESSPALFLSSIFSLDGTLLEVMCWMVLFLTWLFFILLDEEPRNPGLVYFIAIPCPDVI